MKKIIVWLICIILFLAALVVGISHLRNKLDEPTGMYLEHEGISYEADDTGLIVHFDKTAKFTVLNAQDWGLYTVNECKVKVYANTTESCNFGYTVEGSDTPLYFSLLEDVSQAFVKAPAEYDGKGIRVDKDGNFELVCGEFFTMETVISRLNGGKTVQVDGEVDISAYPYFILEVRSPDGAEIIKLPFTLHELKGEVESVKLNKTQVVF